MAESQPKLFVELGTHAGNSYFSFCQAVRDKGLITRCYAVDTWQGDEQAGFYGGNVFELVNQHNESQYKSFSTLYRMTFDEALAKFQDQSVELLHIDGLHTYEAVHHDFETWFPKLAPGALVLLHDIKVTHGEFGVWKFWAELKERYPQNFEFRQSHGLGVIQLPSSNRKEDCPWLREGTAEEKILLEVMSANGESLMAKVRGQELERLASISQIKAAQPKSERPMNLELFFAQESGIFSEEDKISEPLLCRDNQPVKTRILLQGKAARSILWRIDPGCQAGRILIRSLKFFSEDSKVVWDLQGDREKVVVGGTATALPHPAVGIELVSTGNDPAVILPKLPSEVLPVASLQIELEIAPLAEAIDALAKFYAEKEGHQRAVMTQMEGRVKQLEESLEAKKQEAEANSHTREAVEKSLGELKSELAKQRKVQREAILADHLLVGGLAAEPKKSHGDITKTAEELINELRELAGKMHERQDHLQQKNLAEMEILRTTFESRMSKNENNLQDVARYAGQIQDSVIAPSSYMIPAPFSWYAYLYKMLKIRKPGLINKTPTANSSPPRPGFWRRLERSIRKRRKRWIAGISFDRDWYLKKYPDVKKSGMEPPEHYIVHGRKENRQKNEKDFLTKNKLTNNNEFTNENNSHPLVNNCIGKNQLKKNKNHQLPFKPSLLIGVPVYKESESVQQLIKSLENCLEEINNQNAIIIFINDYPGDSPLIQKLQMSKHFQRVSLFQDNLTNEGFIKTSNKFFQLSISNKCDIVLLNSDTIVFPGAITELIEVAKSDSQIGFVSPRSNNASLCSWPIKLDGISNLNSGEWFKYHQQISKHFPKLQITPTCCGFCLYIKWSILDDLGGFDEVYGKGYEEENDLILRANMVGYKAGIANNAFVWHKGSASFEHLHLKAEERKKINFEIICKKYQNYPAEISSYFNSPSYKAEILLCSTQLIENKNIYIGQDLLGTCNNGTSEIAVNIYKEIQKLDNSSFKFITHISHESAQYHEIKSSKNLRVIHDKKDIPFCRYGLHLSQPFHLKTLKIIFTKCLITSFWMLDTIADDCFQLKSRTLSRMWQFSADFSDKIFGISQESIKQFAEKYDLDVKKAESILLSCQPKTLTRAISRNNNSEKYILIFGNHFEHKFLQPTIRLLIENEIREKIVVFGINGISSEKIRFIPSGNLLDIDLQDLISAAICVVYPTIVEGFGLPVRDVPYLGVPIICRKLPSFVEIKNNLPAAVRENIYFFNSQSDLLEQIKTKAFSKKNILKSESLSDVSQISWKSQFNKILECLTGCDEKNFIELKKRMFYLESII